MDYGIQFEHETSIPTTTNRLTGIPFIGRIHDDDPDRPWFRMAE